VLGAVGDDARRFFPSLFPCCSLLRVCLGLGALRLATSVSCAFSILNCVGRDLASIVLRCLWCVAIVSFVSPLCLDGIPNC
jgi:hypothetical protein